MSRITKAQLKELADLRRREMLPHLFGWRWYAWAWSFFESTNRFNFLCAANQISKSSTQIRKAIHWATDQSLWPKLWRQRPTHFWYLYPSRIVATQEFNEKWVPEFMPRGVMKEDPIYGWKAEFKNKDIHSISFNSGITIYFKTYEQDTSQLQSSSVYAIFTDEELPFEHFNELRTRLTATHGYFHMVFTATLGQDEWRRTMEPANETEELFKDALKLTISMWDCLKYKDGSPSFWTPDRIREIEIQCATEAEVQKRVYGRFVISGGLKCSGFNRAKNVIPRFPIPAHWQIYTGVDIGSGGEKSHPASIVMVAVRPDYKYGVVFKGWRGDNISTTSSDILEKYVELCTYEIPLPNGVMSKRQMYPVIQSYDWQAKDFFTISSRAGIPFTPANKGRLLGENLLNTLFKLGMLNIFDGDPELSKLVIELTSLKEDTPKQRAVDDFYDGLRYAAMPIPWDFDGVAGEILKEESGNTDERTEKQIAFDERRPHRGDQEEAGETIEEEFLEWQSYFDGV